MYNKLQTFKLYVNAGAATEGAPQWAHNLKSTLKQRWLLVDWLTTIYRPILNVNYWLRCHRCRFSNLQPFYNVELWFSLVESCQPNLNQNSTKIQPLLLGWGRNVLIRQHCNVKAALIQRWFFWQICKSIFQPKINCYIYVDASTFIFIKIAT